MKVHNPNKKCVFILGIIALIIAFSAFLIISNREQIFGQAGKGLKINNSNYSQCSKPCRTKCSSGFICDACSGKCKPVSTNSTAPNSTAPNTTTPNSSNPVNSTVRTVSFTPSQTSGDFLALLRDETIDVIELDGTYNLPYTIINIDRTRPVLVRPAEGATVIFSGANIGTDPQFWFGLNGKAGGITMRGFIFDGFILGQQGIIQARDVHNMAFNDMTVRNSRANSMKAQPYHSWAIYLDANSTVFPVNFTANNWTVDISLHQMSALQVYGGNITARNWKVTGAYYAVYASGSGRGPINNLILDGWTITDSGAPCWGHANVSVAAEYASGAFGNMHLIKSGEIMNVGTPRLVDGGGNIAFP